MAFSVEKLITGDPTITLTDDGTTWSIEYQISNRNINDIILYIDFTKDKADLSLEVYIEDEDINTSQFVSTKVDNSSAIVNDTLSLATATCKKRIIFGAARNEEKIIFKITPSDATGTDVLKVAVREDSLGA